MVVVVGENGRMIIGITTIIAVVLIMGEEITMIMEGTITTAAEVITTEVS